MSSNLENTQQTPLTRLPVLVPFPFNTTLDYLAPLSASLQAGDIVTVPLGKKNTTGIIWDQHITLPPSLSYREKDPPFPKDKLRFVNEKRQLPRINYELRHFIAWVAAYTFSPPGMIMAVALRPFIKGGEKHLAPPYLFKENHHNPNETIRRTPQREKILTTLRQCGPLTQKELLQKSGVTSHVLRGLIAHKAVITCQPSINKSISSKSGFDQLHYHPPTLSQHQLAAAKALRTKVQQKKFDVTLLEGVTGSGKTETYFEAIDQAVQQGQQVLVLLPEIALSSQWSARFKERFGHDAATWHSAQTQKNKRTIWVGVCQGHIPVIVGARSALFLPFKNLGCIIVDEEHETLFKQEEGVLYNGRDMAIVRAKYASVPVILATATPALETLVNVQNGRFDHVLLPTRHGQATLPDIHIVDMRQQPASKGKFLSPILLQDIKTAINAGQQAMLFLNRRGYAPLTLCRQCGYRIECPYCSAWMVEHRSKGTLSCHYCDYTIHKIHTCPHCHAEDSLTPIGPGIERITAEARDYFKEARIMVMSSDTLSSPASIKDAVEKITHGHVDLIIGTQVIAKGWHFPYLTKVGIVDADLGLSGADLRAGERTLQLLHQVAGRAGRAHTRGDVILQSYMPEHPVLKAIASGNLSQFLQQESQQRKAGHWPPWGRLAAIVISAPVEADVEKIATAIAAQAPKVKGMQILGPAPAPIEFLRGRHRRRLLLRTRRDVATQPILYHWLHGIKLGHSARLKIDIDPVSFL